MKHPQSLSYQPIRYEWKIILSLLCHIRRSNFYVQLNTRKKDIESALSNGKISKYVCKVVNHVAIQGSILKSEDRVYSKNT